MEYLPAILTAFGVILGVIINAWLGKAKQKTDIIAVDRTADNEFRDDLLERTEQLVKQLEYKDTQIAQKDEIIDRKNTKIDLLQQTLAQLSEKIVELNITIRQKDYDILDCQREKIGLQKTVESFERKVYYIREIAKPEETKPEGESQTNG